MGGNGGSGAGICNAGILALHDCTVSKNATGSGGTGGFATASQYGNPSGKGGDGGGIFNAGKLVLDRCTLSGNSTGVGGWGGGSYLVWTDDFGFGFYYTPGGPGGNGGDGAGIHNTGKLTLDTCTVSSKTNGAGSGGFGGDGSGGNGGIYSSGPLTIESCTVAGNSGGAGSLGSSFMGKSYQGPGGNGGILNATNSPFAPLRNSLVALNAVGPGGVFFVIYDPTNSVWTYGGPSPDLSGAFTSKGHNLIGQAYGSFGFANGVNVDLVGTGSPFGFANGVIENLVGTGAGPLDPLLARLVHRVLKSGVPRCPASKIGVVRQVF